MHRDDDLRIRFSVDRLSCCDVGWIFLLSPLEKRSGGLGCFIALVGCRGFPAHYYQRSTAESPDSPYCDGTFSLLLLARVSHAAADRPLLGRIGIRSRQGLRSERDRVRSGTSGGRLSSSSPCRKVGRRCGHVLSGRDASFPFPRRPPRAQLHQRQAAPQAKACTFQTCHCIRTSLQEMCKQGSS